MGRNESDQSVGSVSSRLKRELPLEMHSTWTGHPAMNDYDRFVYGNGLQSSDGRFLIITVCYSDYDLEQSVLQIPYWGTHHTKPP